MTPEQKVLLNQAHQTLEAAKLLSANGYLRDAVSRAYYSMLYTAEAFLVETGTTIRSHQGIILAFGRDIANTGRVPVEYHRRLIDAERLRNKADYRHQEPITPEEAQKQIADAEQLLQLGHRLIGPEQEEWPTQQLPEQLWQHYSQGVPAPIEGKQLTAIARRALQDNLEPEVIRQMLLEAPYLKGLQQRRGLDIAQEFARLAVRNAENQMQRSQQPQPLPKREQEPDFGPEL